MRPLHSKTKLFRALDEILGTGTYFQDNGLKAKGIDDETYGRDSRIYIRVAKTHDDRRAMERELIDRGFKVNRHYWPGSSVIEVSVSYFKGLHWDV